MMKNQQRKLPEKWQQIYARNVEILTILDNFYPSRRNGYFMLFHTVNTEIKRHFHDINYPPLHPQREIDAALQ